MARSPKPFAVEQFGKLIRKRHGIPASGAEIGVCDIPCPKYAKTTRLAHSLFLPYFCLGHFVSGLHIDLTPMEEIVNLSSPHPSQSRIAHSLKKRKVQILPLFKFFTLRKPDLLAYAHPKGIL